MCVLKKGGAFLNFISLDLFLQLILFPLLILTGILIMVSAVKMWRKYHLDRILCFTILLIGLVLLVIGIADFIANPVRALSLP